MWILFSNLAPKQIGEAADARAVGLRVQAVRVEQYGAHPDRLRRERVERVRVADEGGLRGLDAEPFERETEDGRVGLPASDEVRVDEQMELVGQPGGVERVAQAAVLGVRDNRDEEPFSLYLINHARGVGVNPAPDVPLGVRLVNAADEGRARILVEPEPAVHLAESPVTPGLVYHTAARLRRADAAQHLAEGAPHLVVAEPAPRDILGQRREPGPVGVDERPARVEDARARAVERWMEHGQSFG